MRLLIYFILMALSCSSADSQVGFTQPELGKNTAVLKMPDYTKYKFPIDNKFSSIAASKNILLSVPDDISPENKKKLADLLSQIESICKTCSTAGTIGTEVVSGLNASTGNRNAVAPLFPIGREFGSYVTIKKSEYEQLKDKAEKYDLIAAKK